MARSQKRSKRKISGGKYHSTNKKLSRLTKVRSLTKLGNKKVLEIRKRGGIKKPSLFSANEINVFNPKTKKSQKTKIKNVSENPANKNYIRRNILTKGTIVETDLGKVKITSRPGQERTINGILI